MTDRLKKIKLPPKHGYGAAELKHDIEVNTSKAFIFTMFFIVFVFLTKLAIGSSSDDNEKVFHYPKLSGIWVNIDPITEKRDEVFQLPPEIPEIDLEGLKNAVMGTLVPVPGADIDPNGPGIATIDELEHATSQTGNGIIDEELVSLKGKEVTLKPEGFIVEKVIKEPPGPGVFVDYDVRPLVDLKELQALIVYPRMAIEAGIEGRVLVQFKIDEDGNTSDVNIIKSDSQMLNQAAIEAVLKLKCVPAVSKGKVVSSWVTVPIQFRLSRN